MNKALVAFVLYSTAKIQCLDHIFFVKSNAERVNGIPVAFADIREIVFAIVNHATIYFIGTIFRNKFCYFLNVIKSGYIRIMNYFIRQKTAFNYIYTRFGQTFNNFFDIIFSKTPFITISAVAQSTIQHFQNFYIPNSILLAKIFLTRSKSLGVSTATVSDETSTY